MWKKMKAENFKYHNKLIYKNGSVSNFIENTLIQSSYSLEEIVYIRYIEGKVVGAIRINKTKKSKNFVSMLRTDSLFHIRNLYSDTLEEAKLKSDLFLIEAGFDINFPGV